MLRDFMGMITAQEYEVACVAHYMGYQLTRGPEGYVLSRTYGAHNERLTAPTLEEISKHLKH